MQRIITFARRTKKYVREFNLFENEITSTDPFDIRTAIISTRIYIVLLIISLSTLLIFNLMDTQPEIVTILNPSEQEYKIFLNKYGNQSSCPCSRITISYINFTSTTVNYHPICQSIFVSNDWIHHLFNSEYTKIYQLDFRALANNYFQLLATFCSHVKRSVNDTLDNFYLQTFLTPNVLLQNTLDTEINITSQFLRSSIANSVHQLLQLVRTTTRSNRLQTVIPLSTMLLVASGNGVDILKATTVRYVYSELPRCSCYSMTHCPMPSGFFNSSQRSLWIEPDLYIKPLVNVPGFSVECFPVDSLLQSTLECLYDSSCLNTIHTFIPSSNITGVHTLDISQTRFPPNTSVELLINQLFIIEWSMKANFSNYYAQCAPIRCTHTLFKGKEPLYIFIKLLSLYGGLTTALRFFVPRIIAFWRKRRLASTSELRPSEYSYFKT